MTSTSTRHLSTTLALTLTVGLSWGCGAAGSAFGPTFPDNQPNQISALQAQLAATTVRAEEPVVAGLIGTGEELFVYDLRAGETRWRVPVESAVGAPHVAGDLVLLHEGRGVVARRLRDGAEAFVYEDDGLHLVGAGGDGTSVAFGLSAGSTGVGLASKLVFVRGGSVAWARELPQTLGSPTVAGDLVFVPWATQNLSVLDASGAEITRLRLLDAPLGHVWREGREIYFGQRTVLRLGALAGDPAGWAQARPELRELPGNPALMVETTQAPPSPESATHRLRLAFAASASGDEGVGFADDAVYAVFYRLIFALHASDDRPVFVSAQPEDVAGVHAVAGGLYVMDAGGGLRFLDADGRRRWEVDLDFVPIVATFRPAGFVPPESADPSPPPPLHDALLEAARLADARLVPARTLAVQFMREIPEDDVTQYLIDLCEQRRTPRTLREEACVSLSQRTTGVDSMVLALRRHDSYLERTTAGPVGPLATALAAQDDRSAIPLLLDHLRDPATPDDAIAPLARALGTLEAREAAEPLRDFLTLYHSEASGAFADGLVEVTQALLRLEGIAAEPLVEDLLADPFTSPGLREGLADALEAVRAERLRAEEAGSEGEGEGASPGDADGETARRRPSHTTTAIVERLLSTSMIRLRSCLQAHEARSARVVLTLAGDGRLERINVTPTPVRACVEPVIRRIRFPGNSRNAREQIRYTIRQP